MSIHEDWEAKEGWEKIVAHPVIDYPLAPRDARRVLIAAGKLKAVGVSMSRILGILEFLKP